MANLKFYPGDTAMTRDGRRATVEKSDGGVRGWPIRICLPKGGAMTARRSGRTSDLREMPEDLVAIVERAKPKVLPTNAEVTAAPKPEKPARSAPVLNRVKGVGTHMLNVLPEYVEAACILAEALDDLQIGKGSDRHTTAAASIDFAEQDSALATRMMGIAGPGFQIIKKTGEARRMFGRDDLAAARLEMIGVIGYAVLAII
jgi:hypothetical protein